MAKTSSTADARKPAANRNVPNAGAKNLNVIHAFLRQPEPASDEVIVGLDTEEQQIRRAAVGKYCCSAFLSCHRTYDSLLLLSVNELLQIFSDYWALIVSGKASVIEQRGDSLAYEVISGTLNRCFKIFIMAWE